MKKIYNLIPCLCIVALFAAACGTQRQLAATYDTAPPDVRRLADSILQQGLDHEALYTLLGRIKPISSVAAFGYPLANTDSLAKRLADVVDPIADRPYLDSLRQIQQAVNLINSLGIPDVRLILSPFSAAYGDRRSVQLYAVRISLLDSLLKAEERFFGQFGLVPGADPAVVVNTVEYEDRYERLRGYGYLFGYPPYAVDFFVHAFHQSDTSGQHVARDFFQVPVFTRADGHFVYAIPKGHRPTAAVDSALYHRSAATLARYTAFRKQHLNADSTLRAMQLLLQWQPDAR